MRPGNRPAAMPGPNTAGILRRAGSRRRLTTMIDVVRQNDFALVTLRPKDGMLDDAAVEHLAGSFLGVAAADPPRMALDLSEVRFFGSSFIELVFRVWKRLKERGGAMVLCCLHPYCAEVLRVTKLDTLWPSCSTHEEAAAKLAQVAGRGQSS